MYRRLIHTKLEVIMDKQWKVRSTFLNNCYEYLFSDEERRPLGYIAIFFMIILLSTVISLFILSVSRHLMWI